MQYFETYSFLLGLMNNGVPYYSVSEVAKSLSDDDADDVESASQILEEYGIVTSCGNNLYAFVGGIEVMRSFIVRNSAKGPAEKGEEEFKKIELKDITDTKWSLVKKEEASSEDEEPKRRRRNPFGSWLDDDSDDTGDFFSRMDALRRRKKRMLTSRIYSFMENKRNYNLTDKTFSPLINISYPDGTPFVLRFVTKDDTNYFTDNGLLKKYLSSITSNLPISIAEGWIHEELTALDDNSMLKYEDDTVYNDIDGATDEEDLNGEISYFVKTYENYFTIFFGKYKNVKLNEIEAFALKKATDTFFMNTYNEDFIDDPEEREDYIFSLLSKMVLACDFMNRSHALELAERLVNTSRDDNGGKNLAIFEGLLERIRSFSDIEFLIFRNAINQK